MRRSFASRITASRCTYVICALLMTFLFLATGVYIHKSKESLKTSAQALTPVKESDGDAVGKSASGSPSKEVAISSVTYVDSKVVPGTSGVRLKQARVEKTASGIRLAAPKTLYSHWNSDSGGEYSLSPDGRYLLVTQVESTFEDLNNLLRIDVTTGESEVLRGDSAGYSNLNWSSNGQLISYTTNEGHPRTSMPELIPAPCISDRLTASGGRRCRNRSTTACG